MKKGFIGKSGKESDPKWKFWQSSFIGQKDKVFHGN